MCTIGVECALTRCALWERIDEQLLYGACIYLEVQRRSQGSSMSTRLVRSGGAITSNKKRGGRGRTKGNTLILSSVHGGSSFRGTSFPSLSIVSPVLCAAAGLVQSNGWGAERTLARTATFW